MEHSPVTPNKRPKRERPHYETRRFRIVAYITIAMLLLIIAAIMLRQYMLLQQLRNTPWPDIGPLPAHVLEVTINPEGSLSPDATLDPNATPYIKPIPVRISFPRFDVVSDVYPVGETPEGNIDTVDSAEDSAWFEPYPAPGEPGNAIINGHVSFNGSRGSFAALKEMVIDDEVIVEFEDGAVKYFEVYRNETYLIEEFPEDYLEPDGEARLTLITCKGDYDRSIGTSRSRVVVLCRERT